MRRQISRRFLKGLGAETENIKMNYTHLFSIEWDDSYNDPDFKVPTEFQEWIKNHEQKRETLARHLEWLATVLRSKKAPFETR